MDQAADGSTPAKYVLFDIVLRIDSDQLHKRTRKTL